MDPSVIAAAIQAVDEAVNAGLELDRFLAEKDAEFRKVLIKERTQMKQWLDPLVALFDKVSK